MRKTLLFLWCGVLAVGVCGCSGYEEYAPEDTFQERVMVLAEADILLMDAVYHEGVQSWICPKSDPYRLENFQQAYDNLASGQLEFSNASNEFAINVKSIQNEFSASAEKQLKLQATHYAVKILPKTENEQWLLESDEQIKVTYVPFDYVSLAEEQVQNLRMSRSQNLFREEAKERRYSVTFEGGMSSEGPVDPVTYELPVLYAVWPCNRPFPADMDYEILYDVFLPGCTTAGSEAIGLSAEALQALEGVAISRGSAPLYPPSGPIKPPSGPITLPSEGYPTGRVLCYDSHLDSFVPLSNLKIRFSFGSNIYETVTGGDGSFALDKYVFNDAIVSFVFQDKWSITHKNSTTIITETKGTFKNLRESNGLNFNINSSSAPDPRYEIHRAVAFYQYGVRTFYGGSSMLHLHEIPRYYTTSAGGLRIEAHDTPNSEVNGRFNYNFMNRNYIQISNNNRNYHPRLMGTVLHELGHYTQFALRDGYSHFHSMHKLLKESWASYAGWHMGEMYYSVQRLGSVTLGVDITGQARQDWYTATKLLPHYSPLFIDLRDNYNQFEYLYGPNTALYPLDTIQNVPYSVKNRLATEGGTWDLVKSILREYLPQNYYTEAQLSYLLGDWNEYFFKNPS